MNVVRGEKVNAKWGLCSGGVLKAYRDRRGLSQLSGKKISLPKGSVIEVTSVSGYL